MLNQLRLHKLLIAFTLLCGCDEQLVHDLNESEANRLITRLQASEIEASKAQQSDGKWSVVVAHEQYLSALRYLDQARLLKSQADAPEYQSSMIASRDEQRFQFERSLSKEIEATLRSVGGVLEARVHLNLPQVDPLLGRRLAGNAGSGSVLLVTGGEFSLSNEEVAQLVSGACGISNTAVSVLISKDIDTRVNGAGKLAVKQLGAQRTFSKVELMSGVLGSTLMLVGSYAVVRTFRSKR